MLTNALLALLAAEPPPNAVLAEMALLHEALVVTLVGVETANVDAVPAAFHKVHAAKEETARALDSGAWKPKAGTTVADFKKQDEAFHRELEKLVKAAAKKDVPATAKQLGAVITGCPACHAKFRPEPAKAP
ncbi:MAG: cytochrome c [Myxococcaceae bacterium]|nr:cytochrome c [Myxococcaceae bacterium]